MSLKRRGENNDIFELKFFKRKKTNEAKDRITKKTINLDSNQPSSSPLSKKIWKHAIDILKKIKLGKSMLKYLYGLSLFK